MVKDYLFVFALDGNTFFLTLYTKFEMKAIV